MLSVLATVFVLSLAACSKSETGSSEGAAGSAQLNWDQGSWNQTNWQ
jgi:hypothetical protein